MRLEFHRKVAADVSRIMHYYEAIANRQLANEFFEELQTFFKKASNSPHAYKVRERNVRRVDLQNFPYHFLFRLVDDSTVRILIIRHHKRRPSLGSSRY